ncbi:MAG: patatin family protein [Eggerthellaceae bacterium]|nr:patatin family protein [Eggerthellaceae bacterium]
MVSNLESNVFKTALLFEGGSMRGAYTCAVAAELLDRGVYFDNVYGVSAGSSNTVNYVSRDIDRVISSFTDFINMEGIGDWKSFLRHEGLWNAHYIYQEAGLPGGALPFDIETFVANPAKATVFALERDTGRDLYFRKEDMSTLDDVMLRVRASSTVPIIMPPPKVNGRYCYDGGFAVGGGLPLAHIAADGFDRVFIVRTRKRGYRKKGSNSWANVFFWRRPAMRKAVLTRNARYNEACDMIDQWEREGRAYVFYCDELTLSGNERDYNELCRNYESGRAQIRREWGRLMDFLERSEA